MLDSASYSNQFYNSLKYDSHVDQAKATYSSGVNTGMYFSGINTATLMLHRAKCDPLVACACCQHLHCCQNEALTECMTVSNTSVSFLFSGQY